MVNLLNSVLKTPNRRIALIAGIVTILDQLTKEIVRHCLEYASGEKVIIPGFFKFVHWGNTGAAWSLFRDNNLLLAVVGYNSLGDFYFSKQHFDFRTPSSQFSFRLICGGDIWKLIYLLPVLYV